MLLWIEKKEECILKLLKTIFLWQLAEKESMPALHPDYLAGSWTLVKLWSSKLGLMKEKAKLLMRLPLLELNLKWRTVLVAFGLVSPEAFEGVTAEDLVGLGFEQETC